MRVGIDFDNTLVCYDRLFHRLAREQGLIAASMPPTKQAIRDHLRRTGREDRWTELQGIAYGPSILDAEPFPDALAVLQRLHDAGASLCIVSHKTRTPYSGLDCDLHAAALRWLDAYAFLDEFKTGLAPGRIFFEPTKEAKCDRIAACRCSHFIDDLPEFLTEAGFPRETRRIWFNAEDLPNDHGIESTASSWGDIGALLLPQGTHRP